MESLNSGTVDFPPASWSIDQRQTDEFGIIDPYGASYAHRVLMMVPPGTQAWHLARTSYIAPWGLESQEEFVGDEYIVGGRFEVTNISPIQGTTTVVYLRQVEPWPDDFLTTGDLIDHMAFDSAVVSPQDTGKMARYLTIDEALAGEINPDLPIEDPLLDQESRRTAMNQVSPEYVRTGKPSEDDVQNLIENYVEMHGERPSDKQIEKLRKHMGLTTLADQENPLPVIHNAEPAWPETPINQDDPTGSPLDADGETNTVLPGAQATLDDEPEGALPSTDGDAGADGAQSDQDYYPTDEQMNTKPYGGEGAAPSTIAWLDPRFSSEVVKGHDYMDIAAAAKNYLMTSTAVKSFTYAEQQEIIGEQEGTGVVASNLDKLDLEGTHYQQLEAQLAMAEATGEDVIWW